MVVVLDCRHSRLILLLESKWPTSHLSIGKIAHMRAMALKCVLLVAELVVLHGVPLHV